MGISPASKYCTFFRLGFFFVLFYKENRKQKKLNPLDKFNENEWHILNPKKAKFSLRISCFFLFFGYNISFHVLSLGIFKFFFNTEKNILSVGAFVNEFMILGIFFSLNMILVMCVCGYSRRSILSFLVRVSQMKKKQIICPPDNWKLIFFFFCKKVTPEMW